MIDISILSSLSLFGACSVAQLKTLGEYVEKISVKRYVEICSEGVASTHIHIVLSGEVCLEKNTGADEPARLFVVRAGEHFGLGEFMLSNYYTTATALTDCELLRISSKNFRQHFMAVMSIREKVLMELSEIARYLLFDVVAGSGINMLAFYLQRLVKEYGREQDGKIYIETKVLQPEIASLLNMSREHVTRLFAKLHEQGVVDFNRGYPVVDKQWIEETITEKDLADFIVYRDYPKPH